MISEGTATQVSVILPCYHSDSTLPSCLRSLERQTFRQFEVIAVDSTPGRTSEAMGAWSRDFPGVHFIHSASRLLPHGARNLGAQHAGAPLLVFTDPDIYPRPDWLERLMSAHREFGGVIAGAIECHDGGWLDRGVHLAKFDSWLAAGPPRSAQIAASGNMLCPRETFEEMGRFPAEHMLGDTLFSWKLIRGHVPITFEPRAVVEHDHRSSLNDLLRERFQRGREFGELRSRWEGWSAGRIGLQLGLTLLPLRLTKHLLRTAMNAFRAGAGVALVTAFPVVLAGASAWLCGETRAYAEAAAIGKRPGG